VVGEGRRVIGNIERVSNLFLTKTVYSVLLALLVGVAGLVSQWGHTDPLLYPFQPIHVTIAAWFTIGIPAFILSLAPNNERARTGFVRRVMTSALPAGTVIGLSTFICYLLAYPGRDGTDIQQTQASTGALITLLIGAVWVLAVVARPYELWRIALVAGAALGYLVIFAIPLAREKFMLDPSNPEVTVPAVLIGLLAAALIEASWWIQGRVLGEPRLLWRRADYGA
jgi:cation-transporting ATPase E